MSGPGAVFGELAAFGRFASRLPEFFRHPLSPADCRRIIEHQLRTREESFLHLLEHGVFAQPTSPYRPLLEAAGVELGDVARLIREHGLEGALEHLYDAGVYVTLEEYKGRRPIERFGLGQSVCPEDFFNPLRGPTFVLHDVGSSGTRRGGPLDLVHVKWSAAHQSLLLEAFELFPRPFGIWCPVPPSRAGMIEALRICKLGKQIDRWFSQTPLERSRVALKPYLLVRTALAASRRWGTPLPRPEHVSLEDATPVARWLVENAARGTPANLYTYPSAAVRACMAAEVAGYDISGTVFRVTGEPYTRAKADVVGRSGSRGLSYYSSVETGSIGMACGDARELDDVHLLSDKLGIIQRERDVAGGRTRVGALVFTTLLHTAPRLLLNIESDDYGVLEERSCSCLFGELGFHRHLHGIHSYDKLTSGGMTFVGSDLGTLLEQTLPARFGGAPTDYQLVEEEHEGIPRVGIVVSPRVGKLDESAVIATVLGALAAGPAYKQMMASVWETGDTLRVVRREPHTTATAKVLPLHLERLAPPQTH